MTDNGTALATVEREYDGLTMAVAPKEALRRVQELQAFVTTVMLRDLDYGVIPGTGDKPSLLQPGAQKLAEIYGFSHSFEAVEQVKDWERGFFYFEYKCILKSARTGRHVGEGIGSCNSRESKYAGRWVFDRDVPKGLDKASLKTRSGKSRKPPYQAYTMYLVPNDDPYSLVNTIQKMAAKRAYIHAIVAATRSAGVFTQDVEDLPQEAFGEAEDQRSWEREEAPPAPASAKADGRKRDSTPPPPHDPETGEVEPTPVQREINASAARVRQQRVAEGLDPTGHGDRPSPAQSARMMQRERELIECGTLQALAKVWQAVGADARSTAITLTQRAELSKVKDRCKQNLEDAQRAEEERANELGDDPGGLGPDAGGP